jgi:CBS domain-containing protein
MADNQEGETPMRAKDVMTKRVSTVRPDTPVRDIARTMLRQRVSALPVVDAKRRVLGMVSEGDLLRRQETGTERRRSWWLELMTDPVTSAREYTKSHGLKARDVMTRTVVSVTPETDLAEVADVLEKWNIKRVPVVKGERLVGILSRRDLLPAIASQRRKAGKTTDAAISEALQRKIREKSWARSKLINIAVNKGVVELLGLVATDEERKALRVMAENIPGVRAVKDQLRLQPTYAAYV